MTDTLEDQPNPGKPLRLWPGVVAVVVQWLLWSVVSRIVPDALLFAILGAMVCGLVVVVWWLFFSRAPWSERIGALGLMVVGVAATSFIVHASISNGMMGKMLVGYSIPVLSLALVAGAVAANRLSSGPRRALMIAIILLACGGFTLVRTGGISGDGRSDLHWRWTQTPEERLLAQSADEPAMAPTALSAKATAPETDKPATPSALPSTPSAPVSAETAAADSKSAALPSTPSAAPTAVRTAGDWPGFRGPGRDGIIRGARIETNWTASPPVQMWRQPIGPGWSSFAVHGDLFYTQEQRGNDEIVACYNVTTGKPVWRHRDSTRFWESNGGAGPRATPTLSNGRVYTFGATGILNALDARTGAVVWSRNAASDTETKTPGWGFSSSPLVVNDLVIIATSGRLAGYESATGKPRWMGPVRGGSYSSPQLMTIGGVAQVLLQSGTGVISVAPVDGTLLWEYAWPGVTIVQPARTADGDVLITTGDGAGGVGTRRLAIAHGSGGWTVDERWTSAALKPFFNDFVVHKGHAYGFDGSILACIDLQDGKRTWKGGRYGHGQLVLLPDQDLLLVLSEEGELALVGATPEQFTEIAKFPAIEGKTWNHPVLVGDVLLVRNGQEMAALRLSLAGSLAGH